MTTLGKHWKMPKESLERRSKTYKDNPEIGRKASKKRNILFKERPEIIRNLIKKREQTYKKYPEARNVMAKRMSATMQGIEFKDWSKFVSREPYDQRWDNNFVNSIRKRDNQVCMLCGIHREKLRVALHVHHINYDKKLSVPQNCISLCNRCHGLTNHNRKYWINLFQNLLGDKYSYNYDLKGNVIIHY